MATPATLRFRARGTASVPNHDLEEARIRAFIGRKLVEVKGEPGRFGFEPKDEADEVTYRSEYVKACVDGDLWPADEATAEACGVKFDPTFGAQPAAANKTRSTFPSSYSVADRDEKGV